MTEILLLTDEEVVALAAAREAAWPGGIPTVEGTERAVREAAFRGGRSLYVRGLSTDDGGLTQGLSDLVEIVIGGRSRIVGYLGDAEYRRNGWGMASTHYVAPTDRDWIFETVSPVGVHQLAQQPIETHRSHLETVLQAAFGLGPEQGAGPGEPAEWLCLLAEGPELGVLVAARRGEVRVVELEPGDEVSVTRDDPAESVGAAIEQLFGAVSTWAEEEAVDGRRNR